MRAVMLCWKDACRLAKAMPPGKDSLAAWGHKLGDSMGQTLLPSTLNQSGERKQLYEKMVKLQPQRDSSSMQDLGS